MVYGICCIYALGQAVWLRDGVIKIRDADCQILANKLTSDRAKATAQKARFMGSAAGWAGQVVKERGRKEGGEHKQHSTAQGDQVPVQSSRGDHVGRLQLALVCAGRGGSVRSGVEGGQSEGGLLCGSRPSPANKLSAM